MDVFEAIKTRRSIRSYQNKPVEENKLRRVLEAARLSPSAVNLQPTSLVVVQDKAIKDKLFQAYKKEWFRDAPVIIVVCADPQKAWQRRDGEEVWKIDAAIAMQSLVLCATEAGLGTCWICAFDEEKAKQALSIPDNIHVVAMTPLGYANEKTSPVTDRKPIEQLVHNDYW